MSDEQAAAEFREFLGRDPGRPAADAGTLSDSEFQSFIDGKPLDVEARAAELKADKDARERAEFLAFAKQEMISKGYDPDTKTWAKPDSPAEDLTVPIAEAEWVVGPDGQPVQVAQWSQERFAQFADNESEIGQLSGAQFSAVLEARQAGRPVVFKAEPPDPEVVNDVYSKFGGG